MIHVLLPAFNEEEVIGPTLDSIAAVAARLPEPVRVVLVDDGSSDATVERATAAAAASSTDLLVLRHEQNGGLGAAIRTGIYRIVDDAGADDVVMAMDADATHPAELMLAMTRLVHEGADVVIASRYVPGATVTGVPGYRRVLSDGGRWLFRLAFPIEGVRDYTCGFRAYAVEPLRRARVVYGDELCTQRGFEATVDLLLRLRQVGIRAAEVPLHLDYSSRVGASKMRVGKTIRSSLWLIGRRWVESFTTYSARRVRARLAASAGAAS
jgi:dolichol-phosphate mannosyltransferase